MPLAISFCSLGAFNCHLGNSGLADPQLFRQYLDPEAIVIAGRKIHFPVDCISSQDMIRQGELFKNPVPVQGRSAL